MVSSKKNSGLLQRQVVSSVTRKHQQLRISNRILYTLNRVPFRIFTRPRDGVREAGVRVDRLDRVETESTCIDHFFGTMQHTQDVSEFEG